MTLLQHQIFLMQTAVLLAALVCGVTVADMKDGNQTDGMVADTGLGSSTVQDLDTIVNNVRTGILKVLLFSIHEHSNTFTLIAGPMGRYINFEGCYIFKQDSSTIDQTSYSLTSIQLMTPQKVTDLYPTLVGSSYLNMIDISDPDYEFILLINEDGAYSLDMATGSIVPQNLIVYWHRILPKCPLLSAENLFFFYLEGNGYFPRLGQVYYLPPEPPILSHTCFCFDNDPNWAIVNNCPACHHLVGWSAGFVDSQNFILFDEANSAIVFNTSFYNTTAASTIQLFRTPASQLWKKFVPPPQPSTSAAPSSSRSTAVTVVSRVDVSSSVPPTGPSSLPKFLVPLLVGILALLFLPLFIYCLWTRRHQKLAKDNSVKVKEQTSRLPKSNQHPTEHLGKHLSTSSKNTKYSVTISMSKQAKGHSGTDSRNALKDKTQTQAESSVPIPKYKQSSGHTKRSSRKRRRSANRTKRSIVLKRRPKLEGLLSG